MSKRILMALLLVLALLMTNAVSLADTGVDDPDPKTETDPEEEGGETEECNHPGSYYVLSPSSDEWHILYCPVCAAANPDDPLAGYVGPDEEHEFEKEVTEASCTKGGKTVYTCTVCGYTKTENKTKKLLHWFGEWSYADNGKHTATCKREGCEHVGTVACETVEYNDLTLCPVCGEMSDDTRMEMIEGATASADVLPKGEVVVRANDSLMSVAFEYGGKMTQPTTPVTVTLPAAAVEGKTLMLLAADGTQSEIETVTEDDTVSFTLDFGDDKVELIAIS